MYLTNTFNSYATAAVASRPQKLNFGSIGPYIYDELQEIIAGGYQFYFQGDHNPIQTQVEFSLNSRKDLKQEKSVVTIESISAEGNGYRVTLRFVDTGKKLQMLTEPGDLVSYMKGGSFLRGGTEVQTQEHTIPLLQPAAGQRQYSRKINTKPVR